MLGSPTSASIEAELRSSGALEVAVAAGVWIDKPRRTMAASMRTP